MRTPITGRLSVIVLGAALTGLGVVLVAWRYAYLGLSDEAVSTDRAVEFVEESWFGWAAGGVGLIALLLGFAWLLSHLPRNAERIIRVNGGGREGTLHVDIASVAPRVEDELERIAPVDHVSSRRRHHRSSDFLRLQARIDPRADGSSLIEAVDDLYRDLDAAFPDGELVAQVVIDGPGRPSRRSTPRVH